MRTLKKTCNLDPTNYSMNHDGQASLRPWRAALSLQQQQQQQCRADALPSRVPFVCKAPISLVTAAVADEGCRTTKYIRVQ